MHLPFEVEVVRSTRRTKTAQARLRGEVLEVRVPASMSDDEVSSVVSSLANRVARRQTSAHVDLAARAQEVARRFDLTEPRDIRWVSNQQHRWGSCTPSTGVVRISDRLASFPDWVLDYVLVHELAHFDVGGHGADFWAIVSRYPLAERARGFLLAKGMEED